MLIVVALNNYPNMSSFSSAISAFRAILSDQVCVAGT